MNGRYISSFSKIKVFLLTMTINRFYQNCAKSQRTMKYSTNSFEIPLIYYTDRQICYDTMEYLVQLSDLPISYSSLSNFLLDNIRDIGNNPELNSNKIKPFLFIGRTAFSKPPYSYSSFLCCVTLKQSPKSMCTNFMDLRLNIMFCMCRSPSPRMYPAIDVNASDVVYVLRRSSQLIESDAWLKRIFLTSSPDVVLIPFLKKRTFVSMGRVE